MIPKIIHYCWFGNNPIPKRFQRFIDGWKKLMPDYEFVCWNENRIDVNSLPFTKRAYELKKLAFVADYTRLYALYNYGGIYLDTDVKVLKRFDPYLDNSFFSSVEYHPQKDIASFIDSKGNRTTSKEDIGIAIHSAIIASEPHTQYIKECLKYYEKSMFSDVMSENKIIPVVLAITAEKYGFKYIDNEQILRDNIHIYPSKIFSEYRTSSRESVAIHYCEGSWVKPTIGLRLRNICKRNAFLLRRLVPTLIGNRISYEIKKTWLGHLYGFLRAMACIVPIAGGIAISTNGVNYDAGLLVFAFLLSLLFLAGTGFSYDYFPSFKSYSPVVFGLVRFVKGQEEVYSSLYVAAGAGTSFFYRKSS